MCGLVGLVAGSPRDRGTLLALVRAMQSEHRFRGPDGEGVWSDGRVAFGHVRLAIHGDPVAGAQPLVDDRGARLVFNGEIYQPREVLRSLGLGYDPRESDGVALGAVLGRRGPEALSDVRGMFAAAHHDPADGSVTLVRDVWGQKPLYLRRWEDGWAFASTVAALATLAPLRLRAEAPLEYLLYRSVGGLHTAFEGIEQLAPGSWCRIEADGGRRDGRYVDPPASVGQAASPADVRRAIDAATAARVSEHLPNVVLLSGGADSSIVAASLQRQRPDVASSAFSVGYDVAGVEDESGYARRMADELGMEHHLVRLGADEVPDLMHDVARFTEDPIQDPVTLPTLKLARSVAAVTKVALTGDGSDEFWAGYERFDDVPETLEAYLAGFTIFRPEDLGLAGPPASYLDDVAVPPAELSPLDRVLRLEAANRMRNYHLARIDKLGMANALELRSPFLDVRVSRLAQSLSADAKRPDGRPKGLLLDAFAADLPGWLTSRQKQPFSMPLVTWLTGGLREHAHDRLSDPQAFVRGYLDPELCLKEFQATQSKQSAMRVWSLLQLEAWHDVWRGALR